MWKKNEDIVPDIKSHCVALEGRGGDWNVELNVVAWGDNPPKFDIRPWSADHTKWGKGLALSEAGMKVLAQYCIETKVMPITEEVEGC